MEGFFFHANRSTCSLLKEPVLHSFSNVLVVHLTGILCFAPLWYRLSLIITVWQALKWCRERDGVLPVLLLMRIIFVTIQQIIGKYTL